MKALRLYGPLNLKLEEINEPNPLENWALIKTMYAGICGTDKAIYKGLYLLDKYPIILGHEVVGKVIDGPKNIIGSIVTCEINFPCNKCQVCRMGLYIHCPYRKTLGINFDGGMAEYFIAPINSIHSINNLKQPFYGVFIEPIAAILNAFEQCPIKPSMKIAIIGSGNIALLAAQILKLIGINEITVITHRDSPKQKYFENLNVNIIYTDNVMDYVEKRTFMGLGFDYTFEATGSNDGLNLAVKITRPRGIIHIKSTPGGKALFNQTLAVVKELRIIGSRCGTFREFKLAIQLLKNELVKPIISSIMNLSDGEKAFKRALNREQIKVILKT